MSIATLKASPVTKRFALLRMTMRIALSSFALIALCVLVAGVTILDRHDLALRATRAADGSSARWVPYDQIDVDVINAFVTIEDQRFWEHSGVDWRATARAIRDNLRARHVVSGASTITMQ